MRSDDKNNDGLLDYVEFSEADRHFIWKVSVENQRLLWNELTVISLYWWGQDVLVRFEIIYPIIIYSRYLLR